MPETHPPTRVTKKTEHPRKGRAPDPRAEDVGFDSRQTVENSEGVGFAEERHSRDTEHKTGGTYEGPPT